MDRHRTQKDPKTNSSQKSASKFFGKWKILGAAFSMLLSAGITLTQAVYNQHQKIQQQFDILGVKIDHLLDADEQLYYSCHNFNKNIAKQIFELHKKLIEVRDTHKSLGHLVSLQTYCYIHDITAWNNKVVYTELDKVCSLPLKNESFIEQWRLKTSSQLRANQIQRQTISAAIEEFFSQKEMVELYNFNQCDTLSNKTIKK